MQRVVLSHNKCLNHATVFTGDTAHLESDDHKESAKAAPLRAVRSAHLGWMSRFRLSNYCQRKVCLSDLCHYIIHYKICLLLQNAKTADWFLV